MVTKELGGGGGGAVVTSCRRLFHSGMVLGKKVFYLLSSGMECCRWGHGYAGWSDFKGQCLDSAWMDEAMVELVEGGEACFLKIGSISGVGMGRLHIWPVWTGRTWKWELRLHSWAGCFTTFNQLCHMVHRSYTVTVLELSVVCSEAALQGMG